MSLVTAGFELVLNDLTDATTGINKIAIDLDLGGITASQTITFGAAVGGASSGTVEAANVPITFTIPAGERVSGIVLYNNTTILANISVPEATDPNTFDYVVDSLTITLT